jgi:RNA polymerase sigma-70 factor, ECF subfamily
MSSAPMLDAPGAGVYPRHTGDAPRRLSSMTPAAPDVTALLRAWSDGDRTALDRLLPVVYRELHRQAERYMSAQPDGHTLQTTALVHEAYLRLAIRDNPDWNSRAHFFGVAAKAMRSILVDHARARSTAKRGGGGNPVTLTNLEDTDGQELDVLDLDDALVRLAELDERKGSLVELRYFAGLSIEEAAESLGISSATAKREWRLARAWLRRELGGEPE